MDVFILTSYDYPDLFIVDVFSDLNDAMIEKIRLEDLARKNEGETIYRVDRYEVK